MCDPPNLRGDRITHYGPTDLPLGHFLREAMTPPAERRQGATRLQAPFPSRVFILHTGLWMRGQGSGVRARGGAGGFRVSCLTRRGASYPPVSLCVLWDFIHDLDRQWPGPWAAVISSSVEDHHTSTTPVPCSIRDEQPAAQNTYQGLTWCPGGYSCVSSRKCGVEEKSDAARRAVPALGVGAPTPSAAKAPRNTSGRTTCAAGGW